MLRIARRQVSGVPPQADQIREMLSLTPED
jgi:hypothetical protein